MERHDLQSTLNYIRASINDCLDTLYEYQDKDFGIDKTTVNRDENPYRMLLDHLFVSLDYVDELSYRIDYGAPDQQ